MSAGGTYEATVAVEGPWRAGERKVAGQDAAAGRGVGGAISTSGI
jgi:hypothetical protein